MNNILYLINHKTLTDFEIPLLLNKGYGVLINKKYDSLSVNDSLNNEQNNFFYDNFLKLEPYEIKLFNEINWFNNNIILSEEILEILNNKFKIIFITLLTNGSLLKQLKLNFKGKIYYRFFGREKTLKYDSLINKHPFTDNIGYIFSYNEILEFEKDFFSAKNSHFIPLGLSNVFVSKYLNTWKYEDNKICFVCSKIGKCNYYTDIYKTFINNFNMYEYKILGKNNKIIDNNIFNGLDDNEYYSEIKKSKLMYYHGIEPRHLHYHPLEAIIIGIPIIFHRKSLLSIYLNESPGKASSIEEAKNKIEKILNNDLEFINEIINVQNKSMKLLLQINNQNIFDPIL